MNYPAVMKNTPRLKDKKRGKYLDVKTDTAKREYPPIMKDPPKRRNSYGPESDGSMPYPEIMSRTMYPLGYSKDAELDEDSTERARRENKFQGGSTEEEKTESPEEKKKLIEEQKKSQSIFQIDPGIKILRGSSREEKKASVYDACQMAKEKCDFIRVDGQIYYRISVDFEHIPFENGMFFYKKLEKINSRKLLFKLYPDCKRKWSNLTKTQIYDFLYDDDELDEYSSLDISLKYSDFVALENGIFQISKGRLLDSSSGIEPICLTGLSARFITDGYLETPVFDRFVSQISDGDPEVENRFLDFMALTLAPEQKLKKFYVLGTAPDSGKSTILDFIGSLYPQGCVGRMPLHKFEKDFSVGSLVEYNLNISADLEEEPLSAGVVGVIKNITGERQMQSERKRQQSEPRNCCCRLIIATNIPVIAAKFDLAFYNRMEVVPFEISISLDERDPHLLEKLSAERDGIVTKLLLRLRSMKGRNFELSPCHLAEQMKNEWMCAEQDHMENFIDEHCEVTNSLDDYIIISEFYQAYTNYAEACGEYPGSKRRLIKKAKERTGYNCRNMDNVKYIEGPKNHARVIWGIRWKSDSYSEA